MTRTVADLTDDEIVDAIASFGLEGCDDDMCDSDVWDLFISRANVRIEFSRDNAECVEERLERLFYASRLVRESHGAWTPSVFEWGRRLAHRNAEDIAKMLAGET
jgi:hypothetical protein